VPQVGNKYCARIIQKLKIRSGWEGKGIHRCASGVTVVTSVLPFPFFFLRLKNHLAGQKFHEDEEVKKEVTMSLHVQEVKFYDTGIQKVVPRLNKCLDKVGDYFEK
jgi:hypothetical protein